MNADERKNALQRLESMTPAELDALPVGIITLSLDGVVIGYNRREAEMSRRDAAKQLGKNFFTEVAPCTLESDFERQFRELAADGASGLREFVYVFRMPWGVEEVLITFMRAEKTPHVRALITWMSHEA